MEDRVALLRASTRPLFVAIGPVIQEILGLGGQVLADALDGVALSVIQGQKFEAVAQTLSVADNGADFDGIRCKGKRDFESDDLAGFQAASEGCPYAILAHFGGASPARTKFAGLEHFDLQTNIDDEA